MLKTGVNNSIWARGEFMNTAHEQNLSPEAQGALPGEQVAISIIIPVYNVVAWLPRAVDSLTAQTFSDFEILLVDDEVDVRESIARIRRVGEDKETIYVCYVTNAHRLSLIHI